MFSRRSPASRTGPSARSRRVATVLAGAGLLGLSLPAPAAGALQLPAATELAARIQARYNTIGDFTADFTQRQTTPLLPKPVVERGEVTIKKPSRMRWTYSTGDRNQVVSDGTTIYAYFPADRFVSRSPVPEGDDASMALLFLAGRGDLTRDFTATMADDQPDDEWRLVLRPRTKEADFETLTLEVDRTSLAFRGLVVVDAQGGTSAFRFTNMRENLRPSDREFQFTVPRGVEVR